MKRLILGLLMMSSFHMAFATENWFSIAVDSNGYKQYFMSPQYIKLDQNSGGKNLAVWTKDIYTRPVVLRGISYQQGEFSMVLHNVDCENRTRGIERVTGYYADGTIRIQMPVHQQQRPVEPNSVAEAIVNNACSLYGW